MGNARGYTPWDRGRGHQVTNEVRAVINKIAQQVPYSVGLDGKSPVTGGTLMHMDRLSMQLLRERVPAARY